MKKPMPSEDANDEAGDAAIDESIDAVNQDRAAMRAGSLPPVAPDIVEQEIGENLDNIVPTRGYRLTPTVGLGGSAGSIQALGNFFDAMPPDSGLVFVVVLHLSPEHESMLAELLSRHTPMPVIQAEDGMVVEANHVYVIPPGKHLASVDGHLKLSPLESERGRRMAVDVFFRTLADTHGAHSAAIVLSGADGDGAIGIKRIKERGGLTVAQDPEEAEHEGMPRSAITTGMVDWVLKTREIPPRLLEYFAREKRMQLPAEDGPEPTTATSAADPDAQEASLREVLAYLHTRTGRDFSYYKRATVLRRISRRMQINGADTVAEYLTFLRTHPGESAALLQDLLISVTNFFRDREAFTALEAHIPQLFRNKRPNETVRVWVAACASGEEAYSVAMLLFEHARKLPAPPSVQVFATDLAEEALQSARDGIYPAAIATDVSEERLTRFFTREHRGYRVRRELREAVLFAQHDLLKDSPFSKIDLVTCRNLLIYLNADAQQRALDIFHFSLMQRGLLFLGTSESADETDGLFSPLDKKHRLYAAQPSAKVGLPVPVGVSTLARALQERENAAARPVLPTATGLGVTSAEASSWPHTEGAFGQGGASGTYLRMLARGGAPELIVNAQHDIVYLSGPVGRFLQLSAGEPTRDLLHLVHPALRIELRAALARAGQSGQTAHASNLPLELEGQRQAVDIQVTPVQDSGADCFVVTFTPRPAAVPATATVPETDPVAQQLEGELERLKRQLRAAQEQHEVSTEEQKAGNEELQAINEELRSASEELETSREELQATNEELTTVNAELKSRVDELGHANSDLHNLMAATNIATVFLDRELRIARYTPSAVVLFNLIPTDVGRPLTDLKHRLDYPELEDDARRVLARLAPVEREVHMPGDGWFQARLQPYRSLDDRIAGVVLTFVDVTERRRAEEALRESEAKLAVELADSQQLQRVSSQIVHEDNVDALYSQILDAAIALMRSDMASLQALDPERGELRLLAWRGFHPDSAAYWHTITHESVSSCGGALKAGELQIIPDVSKADFLAGTEHLKHYQLSGIAAMQSTPLVSRDGRIVGMVSTHWRTPHTPGERELRMLDVLARQTADLFERAQAQKVIRASEEKYRTLFTSIDEAFALIEVICDDAGKTIDLRWLETNAAFERHTGFAGAGKRMSEVVGEVEPFWYELYDRVLETGEPQRVEYTVERLGRWYRAYLSRVGGAGSRHTALVFHDITERKRREAHQNLLVGIGEELSRTFAPDEIMGAVGERLGEHLKLGVCVFVDVDEVPGEVTVHHGWNREGVTSLEHQTLRMGDYTTEEFRRAGRAGEIFVVRDTASDERVNGEACARLNVGAWLSVPFHREGRWTAFLAVTDAAPRVWRDDEIELVHNVADRVFPRIERARAEEALRQREADLARVQRTGGVGGLDVDVAGGMTARRSPEYLRLHGLPPDKVHEAHGEWLDRVHPADRERADDALRDALAGSGDFYESEYRIVRPGDGEVRWIEARADIERDASGKAIRLVGAHIDITERKRAEETVQAAFREVERARTEAEAANAAKDHFLAVLSHELRTPLMPITMALAALARRGDLPEPIRQTHEMIRRNVELETRFIDELLDVTRIARGKMEISHRAMDLHEAIGRAVEVSTPDIEAKSQTLTVSLEATRHALTGDFARLQQVFWNLLKNASKFTPEGSAISIRSRNDAADRVAVEVTDTGIGMEAEALERIFQPFEQADVSITREFGGLGLGLAIAKASVEAHGGTLSASSPGLGQGTTFTVTLPLTA